MKQTDRGKEEESPRRDSEAIRRSDDKNNKRKNIVI